MKQSGYIKQFNALREAEKLQTHRFTRQLMMDVAMIALNDEFGFGPDRLKRFADKTLEVYAVYADRWNSDTKDTIFTREKLDRKLRQICGEHFQPWEERYDG